VFVVCVRMYGILDLFVDGLDEPLRGLKFVDKSVGKAKNRKQSSWEKENKIFCWLKLLLLNLKFFS
jgi:hypothetical protein